MKKQIKLPQTSKITLTLSVLISLLFFTSLISNQNFLNSFEPPKFYSFFLITSIILFLYFIQIGSYKKNLKIILNLPSLALLIYFFYVFLQLLVTGNLSLQNHKFTILLLCTMLYFVISNIINENKANNKLPIQVIITGYLSIALVQSFYAVAQLAGVMPNLMPLYTFGGALGNPNILATYLISILPFALSVYLFNNTASYSNKYLKTLSLLVLFIGSIVVILSKSRAAWLGLLGGLYLVLHYKFSLPNYYRRFLKPVYSKLLVVIVFVILIILIGKALYNFKPNSADGRIFIWKNTAHIIEDNPIFGIGHGRFPIVYNNYQANYFATSNDVRNARLADCIDNAYNEFLQIFAETGIVGFVIFLSFILSLLFLKEFKKDNSNDNILLYVAAYSSFTALLINSLVSYTIYIDVVFLNFIFLAATLSAAKDRSAVFQFTLKRTLTRKLTIIVIIALFLLTVNKYNTYKEERNLSNIVELLKKGMFVKAKEECINAYPYLNENVDFILLYGKALQFNRENDVLIDFLESSKKYCYSEKLYMLLGDAYLAKGDFKKSEENYMYVSNMIPVLLTPKASLVQLYEISGQTAKAMELAKKIISMKEKVPSLKTKKIKIYMQNLINRLNTSQP